MPSRRSILRNLAALAVGDFAERGLRDGPSVPPAIASLPILKGLAVPFSNEEYRRRIEKAQWLMHSNRLEAIVLPSGSSTRYFAKLRLGGSERLWALVLPVRGRPFLLCPAFETDRATGMLAGGPLQGEADIRVWQEDESPYALLMQCLKDCGIVSGRVGLDESAHFVFVDGLRNAAGSSFEFVSATPVTAGCRMIKDAHEIECLRLASRATLLVYEAVYRSLHEGMTQTDVGALVAAAYERVGFPGDASINMGVYTALPHGSETPQIIKEGTLIMLDDGCEVEGYTSDITRTFVLGTPTAKMKSVFEIVQRAQAAALKAARPGVTGAAVDQAAREVITQAGYGPGFRYFTHRVGHGLGMDMHEWNYLVANNMFGSPREPVLQTGMVFSDEPGIYLKGEFGIRLEDDMYITHEGAELLSKPSASLEHPFA